MRLAHVVLKRVPDNGLGGDFGLELVCGVGRGDLKLFYLELNGLSGARSGHT